MVLPNSNISINLPPVFIFYESSIIDIELILLLLFDSIFIDLISLVLLIIENIKPDVNVIA